MANRYRAQLEPLAGALRVAPPDRYCWFGEWSPPVSRHVRVSARADAAAWRHYFVSQVRARLYQRFYLPGQAVPRATPPTSSPLPNEGPFVRELIAANHGTGSWQPGWAVVEREEEAIRAERGGLVLWVAPSEYRAEGDAPAGGVAVRLPQGFRSQSPGFYLAQSDAPFEPGREDTLVRLYWHLTPAGATHLMALVTTALNAARIPFQFKVLNDPSAYTRNDAGVLYITKRDLRRAARLLERIYREVREELPPGEPALTKRLAPGLGLAEDPRDGDSFGMHRCGLLAEAFVAAGEQGIREPAGVLRLIEESFAHAGLDLERPYLGPGSADDYDDVLPPASWPVATEPAASPHAIGDGDPAREDDAARRARYLAAARAIGDRLAADAVCYDGRCTWLGKLEPEPDAHEAGTAAAFGALGPDLYAGTAGIALVLAQLFAETGDERYARTARGGIAQALRRVEQTPAGEMLGFYTGWPGVALAVTRVGRLVGDDALAQDAPRQLLDALLPRARRDAPDVMSGAAGAILAFLALARLTGEERFLDEAVVLGDHLIATARRDEQALSWPVPTPAGRRALTGFAHGAAGIATALLALYATSGEPRFAATARAAFAFEQRNFSARLGNWLDLRYPVIGPRDGPAAQAASVWCHGAGGIALSRLAAWRVLGEDAYLDEARLAIEAARAWLDAAPVTAADRWSLCHGLPGNADILLSAAALLPEQAAALRVADAGLAALALDESSPLYPDQPGLMRGLAGLGYFFLRLACPDVPSILLPLPEQLSR